MKRSKITCRGKPILHRCVLLWQLFVCLSQPRCWFRLWLLYGRDSNRLGRRSSGKTIVADTFIGTGFDLKAEHGQCSFGGDIVDLIRRHNDNFCPVKAISGLADQYYRLRIIVASTPYYRQKTGRNYQRIKIRPGG